MPIRNLIIEGYTYHCDINEATRTTLMWIEAEYDSASCQPILL